MSFFFFVTYRRPPRSTLMTPPFPSPPRFRSGHAQPVQRLAIYPAGDAKTVLGLEYFQAGSALPAEDAVDRTLIEIERLQLRLDRLDLVHRQVRFAARAGGGCRKRHDRLDLRQPLEPILQADRAAVDPPRPRAEIAGVAPGDRKRLVVGKRGSVRV